MKKYKLFITLAASLFSLQAAAMIWMYILKTN